MILKTLAISRVMWGERQGQLEGEVTFMSPKGEVKVLLTDTHIPGILALCADALVESTKEVAAILTSEIIDVQPQAIGHD